MIGFYLSTLFEALAVVALVLFLLAWWLMRRCRNSSEQIEMPPRWTPRIVPRDGDTLNDEEWTYRSAPRRAAFLPGKSDRV